MNYKLKIINIKSITHDVKQFELEKPESYHFKPGQATDVSIDKDGWRNAKQPLCFTSMDDDRYLQFIIKNYPDRHDVTEQIDSLEVGDAFIIDDPWGGIQYKGPGVFLAGGAVVAPFIAILRKLYQEGNIRGNRLMFFNKADKDIILYDELRKMLGNQFVNVITYKPTFDHIFLDGYFDKNFLKKQINDFSQSFYVCGPPAFTNSMLDYLQTLGAKPNYLIFDN